MFNHEDFALSMQEQSYELIPSEFSEKEKRFISTKIYEFSFLAGESLNNDAEKSLSDAEKVFVVQIIAEWIFHKSVDLIMAEVPEEYRNNILQNIAFKIYNVVAQEMSNNTPEDQLLRIVECSVVQVYRECIKGLPIDNANKKKACNQSYVDELERKMNPPKTLAQKCIYWLMLVIYSCLVALICVACIDFLIKYEIPFWGWIVFGLLLIITSRYFRKDKSS